jgi:potassium/hydrogen antiporter
MWGGLKGAVPILLAALALLAGVEDASRLYAIVFVVVAFSVLVQETSIPLIAAKTGVPLRLVEPEPWNISIGLRREPRGVLCCIVAPGSHADGTTIRDLPIGERTWTRSPTRSLRPDLAARRDRRPREAVRAR